MDAALAALDVCAELLRSRARPQRVRALSDGGWFVHWHNADTEAEYHRPEHHTLSFYVAGGHDVRCLDEPDARGEPGVLCCLPAGHESRWDVSGSLQLLHLYLPRLAVAQAAERWFDLDPRQATLAERIYFSDERLCALFERVVRADWTAADATLLLQQHALDLQAELLLHHAVHRRPAAAPRGGLSPQARRRVLECVETALEHARSVGLPQLAEAACLSEFHFARMFKQSFGVSPHGWVMQRRVQRARMLLADARLPLADVAQRAGYAHLTHLNAALKGAGLGTAMRYRAALGL